MTAALCRMTGTFLRTPRMFARRPLQSLLSSGGHPSLVASDIDSCGEPDFNLLAAAAVRAGRTTDVHELS